MKDNTQRIGATVSIDDAMRLRRLAQMMNMTPQALLAAFIAEAAVKTEAAR